MAIMSDIVLITRCSGQYKAERLAPLGLKPCHAKYLLAICDEPCISQDQLAKRIYTDKSNVARQLAFLEEAGFVRRCTCTNDKRVTRLYPTEQTLAARPQIEALLAQWEDAITADLSEEEMELLSRALSRIKDRALELAEK